MKIQYSTEFNPPAPVLTIAFAVLDRAPQFHDTMALVDTGADMTIVPTEIIEALDAPQQYAARMRAFATGSIRPVAIHQIDNIVNQTRIPALDVIADDMGDQVILGRNFLNKFRIVLDGPNQTSTI